MSQQLQITGGAKVRSLEGVITGSTGVLGSLPINGSNGIPQLDVNGKILVSQLPNSVMEYLGTWNAATNTPTLVNGTGNAGDVYLCNVAGTVNFGAGPITFGVGDQVIYSGTIWQKASGSTGTVTSVAITETGDALTITGSPITTSGTINIGFAGTSAQYVAGDGTLVTFPTITTEAQRLITEVYNETGATLTKGTVVYINGGHGNLPTVAKALATSDATSAQTYGVVQSDIGNNNNGFVVVIGSLTDLDTQAYANGTQLYLSSTVAGAWTSTKQYAPAHLVYVAIVTRSHPTQGVVEVKIMNGFELDELHNVSAQTPSNNDGLFYNSLNALWEARSLNSVIGYTPVSSTGTTNYIPKFTTSTNIGDSLIYDNGTNIGIGTASPAFKLDVSGTARFTGQLTLGSTITNGTYTYTLPGATGVLALTSDLSFYVTLGTLQTITGTKIYSSLQYFDNNVYIKHGISGSSSGYTTLGASTSGLNINLASGTSNNSLNFASTSASNTYTFPNATGTIALTTDLTSYVPTSRTLTINGTTYDLSADRSWTVSGSQWTTSGSNIYYNTGSVLIATTTSASSVLKLQVGDGTTDSRVYFNPSSQYALAFANSSSNAYYLGVATSGSTSSFVLHNASAGTNPLTISYAGNVGIGTTSPSYKLDVTGTGRFTGNLTLTGSYVDLQNTTYIRFSNSGGGTRWGYIQHNGTDIGFNNDISGGKFTFTGGNVGIGTSSPSYTLDVTGTARVTSGIIANSFSTPVTISPGSTTWNIYHDQFAAGDFGFWAGSTNRLLINASGFLGIGSTNPLSLLEVKGGTPFIRITDTTTNSETGLVMDANGAIRGGLTINYGTGEFKHYCGVAGNGYFQTFHTNGSERMRITSTGKVGIGTSNPSNSYQGLTLYGSDPSLSLHTSSGGGWTWTQYVNSAGTTTFSMGVNQTQPQFVIKAGAGLDGPNFIMNSSGNVTITGSLSKGSGSFRIDHPLKSKTKTHQLVHSFIEGPKADLIYRGKITLINGKGQANIDEVSTMTEGTFEVLCREVQCFTTNETGWDLIKGKVIGNIIYIESQNENSTDEISWLVIGERKDKHMFDTEWTDDNGRVIVEPLKNKQINSLL